MPRLKLFKLTGDLDITTPSYYLDNWCCLCQNKMEIECAQGLSTREGLTEKVCVKPKGIGRYELCNNVSVPEILTITITPFKQIQFHATSPEQCIPMDDVQATWLPNSVTINMVKYNSYEESPTDVNPDPSYLSDNFIAYRGTMSMPGIAQTFTYYLFIRCVTNCADYMISCGETCGETLPYTCLYLDLYSVNNIYENYFYICGETQSCLLSGSPFSKRLSLYRKSLVNGVDPVYLEMVFDGCGNEKSDAVSPVFTAYGDGLIRTLFFYNINNPPSSPNNYTVIQNDQQLYQAVFENSNGPQPPPLQYQDRYPLNTNFKLEITE